VDRQTDGQTVRQTDRQTDRYLFLETIRALLAFRLQQAASALRPWVGVSHDNLVTMDHALVAMNHALVAMYHALVAMNHALVAMDHALVAMDHALVAVILRVGGRLMGRVGGVGVVLGLVPRRGHSHGQAGVTLSGGGVACMGKQQIGNASKE